jgi:hypothetical protein
VVQASVEQNPCRHGEVVKGHRCLRDGCVADARTDADLPSAFAPVEAVLAEADELLAGDTVADSLVGTLADAEAVGTQTAGAADAA